MENDTDLMDLKDLMRTLLITAELSNIVIQVATLDWTFCVLNDVQASRQFREINLGRWRLLTLSVLMYIHRVVV